MQISAILEISYLLASVSFIAGLKMLSHPDSARRGNLLAAAGMGLAIVATILWHTDSEGRAIGNLIWIFAAMGVGTMIGWLMAVRIKMTAMPQMVSFFNGMGGACAALISLEEYRHVEGHGDMGLMLTILLGLVIGSVSFSGSMIAYGKLDGSIRDYRGKMYSMLNNGGMFATVGLLVLILIMPDLFGIGGIYLLLVVALLYGIFFVLPIGGADMPVVISLLNSFTGMAAAFGGFLYDNQVMLTGGILVGSAGTILTILMCNAMNRSLWNVLFSSFGGTAAGAQAEGDQTVREIGASDTAILCAYAQRVCIVPGYGLAVAQAQHSCHEFEKQLENRGVEVYYAIHPVAGRMPGHMNVLMAEADVPYTKLQEMEDANDKMPSTDVVLVIGANDVVNPAAENDPSSPIYGMPIIQVNKAHHVIVMKRSMGKGYAGIENPLFFEDKTRMLFGDAKDSLQQLASELKSM